MYFSRIQLDQTASACNQNYRQLHQGIYQEHKLIWSFFEQDTKTARDFLFCRMDHTTNLIYYILSKRKPVISIMGWHIASKEYSPIIKKQNRYAFKLRANPVVTKQPAGPTSKKRKRVDVYMEAITKNKLLDPAKQATNRELLHKAGLQWMQARAEKFGFTIQSNEVLVEGYTRLNGKQAKKGNQIQLGVIDYSGFLSVQEPEKFEKMLYEGIGPAKAFGCGLMLLKPA